MPGFGPGSYRLHIDLPDRSCPNSGTRHLRGQKVSKVYDLRGGYRVPSVPAASSRRGSNRRMRVRTHGFPTRVPRLRALRKPRESLSLNRICVVRLDAAFPDHQLAIARCPASVLFGLRKDSNRDSGCDDSRRRHRRRRRSRVSRAPDPIRPQRPRFPRHASRLCSIKSWDRILKIQTRPRPPVTSKARLPTLIRQA